MSRERLLRLICFALLCAPIASLFVGYWFRWTSLAVANVFTLVFAFALLPLVIARAEPRLARELPRFALFALVPFTVYNLSRIPMNPLLGIVFWDHWYDYGTGTTGLAMRSARGLARYAGAAAMVLAYLVPYVFVATKVATWQFPLQDAIDRRTMGNLRVELEGPPRVEAPGRYALRLRIGSRTYRDYIGATKTVGVGPVIVQGTLERDGRAIAFCSGFDDSLENADQITTHAAYMKKVAEIEFTDLDVACHGPPGELTGEITVSWSVRLTVMGDRLTGEHTHEGKVTGLRLAANGTNRSR
jgi:hypothetical protein